METLAFKLLIPTILIVLSLFLGLYITNQLFTFKFDLRDVFEQTPTTPPQMNLKLNGVDGDWAIIGFLADKEAESALMTQKSIEDIKQQLDKHEIEKWEFLTKVPATFLKFNLYIYNSLQSPNNSKKVSILEVTHPNGGTSSLLPGENKVVGKDFLFKELGDVVGTIRMKLKYSNGQYMAFYDKDGKFVPQSTGQLVLGLSLQSQLLIIGGSLLFLVAIFVFLKQLILSSKDVREILSYFRS